MGYGALRDSHAHDHVGPVPKVAEQVASNAGSIVPIEPPSKETFRVEWSFRGIGDEAISIDGTGPCVTRHLGNGVIRVDLPHRSAPGAVDVGSHLRKLPQGARPENFAGLVVTVSSVVM